MKLSYDKLADVLYITFRPGKGRVDYVETEGGILRVDRATREIVGLTIPFFMEKNNNGVEIIFPEIGAISFNQTAEDFLHGVMAEHGK